MSMVTSLTLWFRNFDRTVRLYLLAALLIGLSVDGVYAVLFNLYLLRLKYDATFIGLVNAFGLFTFAFASLAAGLLGARWGSRKMLILGVSLVLMGGTLLPLAEMGPAPWQEVWIIASYMIIMAGFSFFLVNSSPFLMGSTFETQHNSIFSLYVALSSLAGFGGGILGGAMPGLISRWTTMSLTDPAPYRLPMQFMVLFMLPAFFLIRATTEPYQALLSERRTRNRASFNLKHVPLAAITVLGIIRFLQTAGLGVTLTFTNVYLDTDLQVSTALIGLVTSLGRLMAVPAALLVPLLTSRFGNAAVAIVSTLAMALFLVPLALVPVWYVAGLGFVGAIAMCNIRYPAYQVYILKRFEPRQQALVSGIMAMAAGFSFAMMSLAGGYTIANFSFGHLFLAGSAITVAGGIMLFLFHVYTSRPAIEQ